MSQFWDLKSLAFRRPLPVRLCDGALPADGPHTRFDLKYHFVWITKYRKKLLRADVAVRLRQIVREICSELEVEIIKGHVSKDHVHLFDPAPRISRRAI